MSAQFRCATLHRATSHTPFVKPAVYPDLSKLPPTTDYDNPWKDMIDRYLPAFLELFFGEIYSWIDWTRPVESLNTDLLA